LEAWLHNGQRMYQHWKPIKSFSGRQGIKIIMGKTGALWHSALI
jgi:hypothetical protein